MLPKIISSILVLSPRKLVPIFFILCVLVSSCSTVPPSTPVDADGFTPVPQGLESTPSVNDSSELFSSDQLGLCFSYPREYTQISTDDTVEIAAPDIPGSDVKGLFWLEISDSDNRTAEVIADQEVTFSPGLDLDRWTVTLDGEHAVVLDGMPGQELQRRVYVVHQQNLYMLGFWPVRSENQAASDQMEALYAAVTSSWAWSPCSADGFTPTPLGLESTPAQTNVNDTMEWFSSDQLGLCFSYPRGYAQSPVKDAVKISSLVFPGTEVNGQFWLEISDSYNRTAEVIAYQSMTLAPPNMDIGHWTITVGGEQAVVLDGMPGQELQHELQRRVYIVHQQTLYTLGFWPVRSENKAANDQMEALYAAVTSSWAWSPCSADVFTSTPQGPESTPAQTSVNGTMEVFSNDLVGLCFSYPQGYTQSPARDIVSIVAPDLPGYAEKGRFWLEISNSQNRTAETIADQEAWFAPPGMIFGRWNVMIGGEQAVVLDGMPGQELQRRVFIVRQQTLYMLGFWPVRSKNQAANDQMEALYAAVTSSWAWSPCSGSE